VYESVRLLTDDADELVLFADQLLFSGRLGFKTRPVTIRESAGVAEIEWSGRKPKAFRDRVLLVISDGQHVDCFQVDAIRTSARTPLKPFSEWVIIPTTQILV
jgi:hypothetical protein